MGKGGSCNGAFFYYLLLQILFASQHIPQASSVDVTDMSLTQANDASFAPTLHSLLTQAREKCPTILLGSADKPICFQKYIL
jgi:hypothetical protein